MWQQLDSYCSFTPTNPKDVVAFQRYMDKLQVWDFLVGLNLEYDQVRFLDFCKDPFPTLQQAYNLIQHEESRRSIMLPSVTLDRYALVISRPSVTPNDPKSNPTEKVCDYCGKQRHTKEFCWKLHRRPKGRGGKFTSARSRLICLRYQIVLLFLLLVVVQLSLLIRL
ncbi:hypothetical protein CFOL_v3_01283 [Cephalotus follicularis]|uniref:UBN2_3 domain-containing protein n=1 Tax=Cephalotus follicularis TaxID=3775 RepID=A0A1Q3APS5_CEPFO|nr:hypothetical protein CFOL_v3_01283 [Cephalotus follicularis]